MRRTVGKENDSLIRIDKTPSTVVLHYYVDEAYTIFILGVLPETIGQHATRDGHCLPF